MIICTACKKEMVCVRNGVPVRYGTDGSHVYSGDKYECSECGAKIINCNNNPYYDPEPNIQSHDVCMDPIEQKPKPINLRRTDDDATGRIESGNSKPEDERRIREMDYIGSKENLQKINDLIGIWWIGDVNGDFFPRPTQR